MPLLTEDVSRNLQRVYSYCNRNLAQLERWPGYYKRRYLEFVSYYELLPRSRYRSVLELGCGNGYQSAFLAGIADKVTATDLPDESYETHTPGMHVAMELHRNLNIGNVDLVGCSAEALPFESNTFDLVYASHVLEHIPDREKALQEIYRVLEPGGIFLCIVPTSFEKVYSFFNYHVYLLQRSVVHLRNRLKGSGKKQEAGQVNEVRKAAQQQLRSFPFPPPHGHSKSFLEEARNWTPRKWRKEVMSAAPFHFMHQSSTQFNPLLPVFGSIWPSLAMQAHATTRAAERKYGHAYLWQRIGVNTVIIFVKP